LADSRCDFDQYQVFDLPGSDHHAVFTQVIIS